MGLSPIWVSSLFLIVAPNVNSTYDEPSKCANVRIWSYSVHPSAASCVVWERPGWQRDASFEVVESHEMDAFQLGRVCPAQDNLGLSVPSSTNILTFSNGGPDHVGLPKVILHQSEDVLPKLPSSSSNDGVDGSLDAAPSVAHAMLAGVPCTVTECSQTKLVCVVNASKPVSSTWTG